MSDTMEKGLKEMVLGAALATATPSVAAAPEKPQIEQIKFDPHSLHQDLHPIAHLESSFGKKMNHAAHSKGEFHTALGALGFKPITAYDEYSKSKHLQVMFPQLADSAKFLKEFKTNPSFYNAIAGSHWNGLKKRLGSVHRAVYGWRWGRAAALKADAQRIIADPYVQKYVHINTGLHKSEDLEKMAIANLKPGKEIPDSSVGAVKKFSYDHILSPERMGEGYSLSVKQTGTDAFEAQLHHNGDKIGYVDARRHNQPSLEDHLVVDEALIREKDRDNPQHRGKKLGQALYEALYAHTKHTAGIKHVVGKTHSSMAHFVHKAVARNHGLNYKAKPNFGNNSPYSQLETRQEWNKVPNGPYDDKYGPYKYTLKGEDRLNKAIADYGVGKLISKDPDDTEHYDYSHILHPNHQRKGYKLTVSHNPVYGEFTAHLNHERYGDFGVVKASRDRQTKGVEIETSDLSDSHMGQGFGSAMYEAVMAHAKNKVGIPNVVGQVHSTMASKTHQRLSAKHGMEYKPTPTPFPHLASKTPGAYDAHFGPYQYAIKDEELGKAMEEWAKKRIK